MLGTILPDSSEPSVFPSFQIAVSITTFIVIDSKIRYGGAGLQYSAEQVNETMMLVFSYLPTE